MPKNQKKDDYITNKVLIVFSVCLLGVLALMGLYRLLDYGTTIRIGLTVLRVCIGVSAVGVLAGVLLIVRERKNQIDNTYRIATGRNVAIVFAVSMIMLLLVSRYGVQMIKVFYALLPAMAVYYLIYHSYQPEFFAVSADCGAAVALLFIVRRALISTNVQYLAWVAVAVMAVIAAVQIAVLCSVKKSNGTLVVGSRKMSFVFSKNAYLMMTVTPVVMVALVALGALLGVKLATYAIFAAAGYFFVTAVYYTVKLM